MIPNVHLLGIQGSGKGTQASLLVKEYAATYLASGNLFRERAAIGDPEGLRIGSMIHGGSLLPDELLINTVSEALTLHRPTKLLLCDGVIRTLAQMQMLSVIWLKFGLDQPLLIYLDLDESTARQRVNLRQAERNLPNLQQYHAVFSGKLIQREDDNPQAIEARFKLFYAMTEPIVTSFREHHRCITVSANQSVVDVQKDIRIAIEATYPLLG